MSDAPEANTAAHTAHTPRLLLEHHLKELRLPTILREYDKVARQCAVERVDYPRYLLPITELELLDRERRATERRIRRAKFYINGLRRQPSLTEHLLDYSAFTDIEFNPERSINCRLEKPGREGLHLVDISEPTRAPNRFWFVPGPCH